MIKIIKDIETNPIGSAYVKLPFDKAKIELESNGYRIVSLSENARLRLNERINSEVSRNGNFVREGILYLPDKRRFLTKNSPIIDYPEQATSCNRNNSEFYLNDDMVQKSLSDSIEIKLKEIPTNGFDEIDLSVYLFGENAKKYGDYLKNLGIKNLPIWLEETSDKPFARQVWFREIDFWSIIYNQGRNLHKDLRLRGIK